MALTFLGKRGFAMVQPGIDGSRVKMFALTAKGRHARDRYDELVRAIEERWRARFGKDTVGKLRESLQRLVETLVADLHLCCAAWNPTLRDGEHRFQNRRGCRTIRWFCTAADSRTGADFGSKRPDVIAACYVSQRSHDLGTRFAPGATLSSILS